MPEDILNEDAPAEEPKEEKLSIWQRIKKWVVGGTSAAIVAGGVTVGVMQKSGHVEGDIYVINPITADSLWFADTAEAKAVADSFSKYMGVKETVFPASFLAAYSEENRESVYVDVPGYVQRERARRDIGSVTEKGQLVEAKFYIDDKFAGVLFYKVETGPSEGKKILIVAKLEAVESPK